MADPGGAPQGGLMDVIQRIIAHALGAVRCYISMAGAEGERRGRRLLDQALWMLVMAGVGFAGMALFAVGVAQWLEDRIGSPGSGAMIVGMALMVIFLAIALAWALRKDRKP